MMLESKNKSFENFWTKLLRNLVESVRKPVEATVERSFYGPGEVAVIRVEAADEKYIAVNDAKVSTKILTPSGQSIDVSMKPTAEDGFEGYTGLLFLRKKDFIGSSLLRSVALEKAEQSSVWGTLHLLSAN